MFGLLYISNRLIQKGNSRWGGILCLIFILTGTVVRAQTPTLQEKLYYTCKVWGFVKYYHSEVSTCHVNWDSVLLHTLPLVESSTTSSQFNDALDTMLAAAGPMALSTTYFPDTLAPELKRNRDWSWISSSVLRTDVQTQLDTIKNNFRPHASCWVINNPHTTSNPSWLIFPYDSIANNTFASFPDQEHRLLMMFKYWNIIRYFNPYNYVLDTSWDSTLLHSSLSVRNALSASALAAEFTKITAKLNDTHVWGLSGNSNVQQLPGYYLPKVRLKYISGEYIVIASGVTGVGLGDVLLSADGITTIHWEDSLKNYYSSSNESAFRKLMAQNMLGRKYNGANVTLTIRDNSGIIHDVTASCIAPSTDQDFFYSYYYPADSLTTIKWTSLPCNIGYVNMGNLQIADVNTMYSDLHDREAIIFDLRNYPNATVWSIANLMYAGNSEFAKLLQPDVTYPGTYYWYHDRIGSNGNPNAYSGRIILLMDDITMSQAEYSCMMLGTMPRVVKVGSQTSGADGNITYWRLSTDYQFGFTTLGVFYPNGDSTQRIGIVPDTVVYPTSEGIRDHNDVVLNKAIEIACGTSAVPNTVQPKIINIYPNPISDVVNIELNGVTSETVTITISDLTGKVLILNTEQYTTGKHPFIVSTKSLASGMYLISINAGDKNFRQKLVKQ